MGAVAIDPGRHLDHRMGRQVRERAVVADVDDLDIAGPGVERGDELGRGLAVERPAALLEQGRLPVEVRIAVHLEQLALDGHDVLGPGPAGQLLLEDLARGVVVVEVVRRDGTERAQELDRRVDVGRDLLRHPRPASPADRSTPSTRTARIQVR